MDALTAALDGLRAAFPAERVVVDATDLYLCDERTIRAATPRLMEDLVAGRLPFGLGALTVAWAGWAAWPERERAALEAFLAAWLDGVVQQRRYVDLLDLVDALLRLFDDVDPWLARIGAHRGVPGLCVRLWLAEQVGSERLRRKPRPRSPPEAQLRDWLRDPAHLGLLAEVARDGAPDGEDLGWLVEGADYWLQLCAAEP